MEGTILPKAEEIEVFQRRGVDSIGARKLGKHAEPFTLVTVKYVLDFASHKDALFTYRALIGSDPVEIVKASTSYGNYLLLDVREAEPPQAVYGVVGAIISNAQVRQVFRWTLIGG